MNIERYVWPVIIAVSLHSLLLLSSSDPTVIFPTGKPKDAPREPSPPPDLIELIPEDTDSGSGDSGGSPNPLPPTPDIPRELTKEDVFRVEVTETILPLTPLPVLTKIPEKFGLSHGHGEELRGGPRGVISLVNLDRVPRATVRPSPNYPNSLRDTSGTVTVEFVVDTTGRVVSADAVRWTHREFVDSAVRAVLRWRFEPGTLNGRKVSFRMAVPIEFNAAE